MSESGDFQPAAWAPSGGFTQARQAYDRNAGRSYDIAKAAGLTASKLLPAFIETQSTHPMIIDTDFTGSMNGWDATICSKFPYMDNEIRKEYLSENAEISFGAHTDVGDEYPFQVRGFANGKKLTEEMEKLVHASGGGGSEHHHEAHPLAMLYRLRNTRMPKAVIKPPYIIITDEMPCGTITVEQAGDFTKVNLEKRMTREQIVKETMEKYSLYLILKPYGSERISGDRLSGDTQEVYDCWKGLIGADRIALLPDPARVVDVIFGILAKEMGRIEYFRNELEQRQLPDKGGKEKVETVYKSLSTIHALPKTPGSSASAGGNSKTKGLGGGTRRNPTV